MICWTSCSGNRFFLASCLLAAFLSGCAAAKGILPAGERTPPPLTVGSVSPDKAAPQAEGAAVLWRAQARGGRGGYTYAFHVMDAKEEKVAQEGASPSWRWSPSSPGAYRVRVVARDAFGNAADTGWSPEYVVVPKLEVSRPIADKDSPQAAGMTTVRWKADALGGVGHPTYVFRISDGKDEKVAQEGASSSWTWSPSAPGSYRVRVTARDTAGNLAESGWSPDFTVAPKPDVSSPVPDKKPPQAAEMTTVHWKAEARGGVGKLAYSFRITDGKEERVAQEGDSSSWNWVPPAAGTFRVKAVVRDAIGNVAESRWSPEYKVVPMVTVSPVVPDKASPQAAEMASVRWSVNSAGGVGKRTHAFLLTDGTEERVAHEGEAASWVWTPTAQGTYRVKVVARDAIGNAVENGWSPEYVVVPKLKVSTVTPDKPAPQAAEMATVRWTADAQGGVGERTFAFRVTDGKTESVVQESPSAHWTWAPSAPGTYRVKVAVRDTIGNAAESGWSPDYAVAPKLEVSSVTPDKTAPQAAEMATVRWKAVATGGVGSYRYEFHTTDGQTEKAEQAGVSPTWEWSPKKAGTYRVRVLVRDAIGNVADGGWSSPYFVAPPLVVSFPPPDPGSPQAAGITVRWKVDAAGGVGGRTIEFRTSDGKEERQVQVGPSLAWDWSPEEPGAYKVKAVVRDAIGNAVDSGWSREYRVMPKLKILSVSPDRFPPQAAAMTTVRWKVDAEGGVGNREYSFRISDGNGERTEQKGSAPTWDWSPGDPGVYRVKAIVRDAIGNTADSGWSPEYRIELSAGLRSLIAVMPVENLTGSPVSVQTVKRSLVRDLQGKGLNILGEDALEKFMEKHRVRYTGGLNRELGEALRAETGTNAVLFPALELLDETVPPKVALNARLVSTHRNSEILWADGAGLAGNDAPGFLLQGLVNDPAALWERAKGEVVESLVTYLRGSAGQDPGKPGKRFLPKSFHGVAPKVPAGKGVLSIAVLPFRNESTRRNAGEIMANHFLRALSGTGRLKVIEPGEVRQVLLRSRTIMEGGLSLPQADILHATLNVDLVLTGIVTEYQDYIGAAGNPKVEFSVRVFDMKTRQVVWSSSSYNEGDDSVYFFNLGKVNTAHTMASEMIRSAVGKMAGAFGLAE